MLFWWCVGHNLWRRLSATEPLLTSHSGHQLLCDGHIHPESQCIRRLYAFYQPSNWCRTKLTIVQVFTQTCSVPLVSRKKVNSRLSSSVPEQSGIMPWCPLTGYLQWIYGGAFAAGDASSYDGSALVQRSVELGEPVIYVSFNYRVNAFGWLAGKEALAGGAANLGLYDREYRFND